MRSFNEFENSLSSKSASQYTQDHSDDNSLAIVPVSNESIEGFSIFDDNIVIGSEADFMLLESINERLISILPSFQWDQKNLLTPFSPSLLLKTDDIYDEKENPPSVFVCGKNLSIIDKNLRNIKKTFLSQPKSHCRTLNIDTNVIQELLEQAHDELSGLPEGTMIHMFSNFHHLKTGDSYSLCPLDAPNTRPVPVEDVLGLFRKVK